MQQHMPDRSPRPNSESRNRLKALVRAHRADLVQATPADWVPNPGGGGNWKSNANSILPRAIYVRAIHDASDEIQSKDTSHAWSRPPKTWRSGDRFQHLPHHRDRRNQHGFAARPCNADHPLGLSEKRPRAAAVLPLTPALSRAERELFSGCCFRRGLGLARLGLRGLGVHRSVCGVRGGFGVADVHRVAHVLENGAQRR